jgi:predicted tellurium resistance membrane protein TerC
MDAILNPTFISALFTLTLLEIILGFDNVIFISLLAGKLPASQQSFARKVGLIGAGATRIILIFFASWIVTLTTELFVVFDHGVSGRDLVMIIGGLFLLGKATHEIHERIEGDTSTHGKSRAVSASLVSVIVQIMVLDIVFSIDSVITAVGMTDHTATMVLAVIVSVAVMVVASTFVGEFIDRHPTIKILALGFLLLIGTMLVADGIGQHISKGYIYFAMGFAVLVETLNIVCGRKKAVK